MEYTMPEQRFLTIFIHGRSKDPISSFVPHFVLERYQADDALTLVAEADTQTDFGRKKFFGSYVSRDLVHVSCPQYDCHNWFVQFATDSARRFVLEMFDLQTARDFRTFLTSMTAHADFNEANGALFGSFVLDAIAGGLSISSPVRLVSKEPLKCGRFTLPKIIGESHIDLRFSTNIRRAYLPDISCIDRTKLSPFKPNYDILFQHPMLPHSTSFAELEDWDGLVKPRMNTIAPDSPKMVAQRTTTVSRKPKVKKERATAKKNVRPPNSKCFTYSLNTQAGNGEGFDSILLFFKLHIKEQKLVLDALSVLFIKPTLEPYRTISSSESTLMFQWLALFSNIYSLDQSVIFPFLFFVKSAFVERFALGGDNTTKWFMDDRNIWVVNVHARNVEKDDECTERLILDSAMSQLPNTNPHHFRCCFCGLILKADFPNHHCEHLQDRSPFKSSGRLITSPWVANSSGMGTIGIFDRPHPHENYIRKPDLHPLANDTSAPEADTDSFDVKYDAPILTLFSYFPPQPVNVEATWHWHIDHRIGGMGLEESGGGDNAPTEAIHSEHSHLQGSLSILRLWMKKKAIGFTQTDGKLRVCAIGSSQPLHNDVKKLYANKYIPLAQMFVPMDCLNRLPVTLYDTRALIPFEIKSLLADTSSSMKRDLSSQFLLKNHLRCGQLVTLEDLHVLLGRKIMKEPVLDEWLNHLHSHCRSLSRVRMNDFQLLVSYVNGSSLVVADILELCIKYLECPDQLTPRDLTFLVASLNDNETQSEIL
ncbi:hypothetical protein BLNAU_21506 [Blattamonas nauphoetae]|uniref:C2H2-type domain-containing protein n=1 Tax=Blattamonas nauphoetae TaxID=2049346 RepID=A0ABQ9WVR1_9EUKA|nr:hypothetical protein BLNAU_21506 [Blattamonas nauphoetae]